MARGSRALSAAPALFALHLGLLSRRAPRVPGGRTPPGARWRRGARDRVPARDAPSLRRTNLVIARRLGALSAVPALLALHLSSAHAQDTMPKPAPALRPPGLVVRDPAVRGQYLAPLLRLRAD